MQLSQSPRRLRKSPKIRGLSAETTQILILKLNLEPEKILMLPKNTRFTEFSLWAKEEENNILASATLLLRKQNQKPKQNSSNML